MPPRGFLLVVGLALALGACASPQTSQVLDTALRDELSPRAEAQNTVFYAQSDQQCGPAALAMALTWSGLRLTPRDLEHEVYTPGREGSLTSDMIAAARRHGRIAYPINDLKSLLQEIDAGNPVIVLQNLALTWYPQWHFAVAIGYDLPNKTVVLHSGERPYLETALGTFEKTWERSEYWGLVVLPPGRLPRTLDRRRYVSAVAAVEAAGQTASAAQAYRAGLERWPDDLSLLMGLGNSSFRSGRLKDSAEAFARAVAVHPEAGDAYNNLAHVLMVQGRFVQAAAAAERAVALGGPNLAIYRQTKAAIEAATKALIAA